MKNGDRNGKICLQGYFKPVFESNPSQRCTRMFQSVCQKNTCSLSLSSSIFAGSNPAVCKSISPAVWKICPSGRKKNGTRNRVRERFYSDIRYHSAKRECFGTSRRAMQKQALPENGYRVIPNSAKRFLSALCRRHSNFQPLLLHG